MLKNYKLRFICTKIQSFGFDTLNIEQNSQAINKIVGLYNTKQCDDVELDEFMANIGNWL